MLDLATYRKDFYRMCRTVGCAGCKFHEEHIPCEFTDEDFSPDMAADIVEEWAKANPPITNAQKFKKVFGVMATHDNTKRVLDSSGNWCILARASWWDSEYEGPED